MTDTSDVRSVSPGSKQSSLSTGPLTVGFQDMDPNLPAKNDPQDSVQALGVSGFNAECTQSGQQRDQSQSAPFTLEGSAMVMDENEEIIITNIRAIDVTLRLGRLPVGFYAVVQHSGLEWRTSIKPADDDNVEWEVTIPLPSNPSASVCLRVYGSFEFQPILGNGDQLRKLIITAGQLLDQDAELLEFSFLKENDIESSCTSLFMTFRRRKRDGSDLLASGVLSPQRITDIPSELEEVTDNGHIALSRYEALGDKQDLELAIEQFERALGICSSDHLCRAAALSNMAAAKFLHCRRDDTNVSLDVPLTLYHDALEARPVGHPDRPLTLIQLAAVYYERFEKEWNAADELKAKELLHEVMDLSSANNYESEAAATMLRQYAARITRPAQAGTQSSAEDASGLTEMDPWTLNTQLLQRFKRFGNLDDLERAISVLETSLSSASIQRDPYSSGLANLGVAFLERFRRLGDLGDIEKAISRLRGAIELSPNQDPDKHIYARNLGDCFKTRFERLGDRSDLDQAILRFADALNLIPDNAPNKCTLSSHIGSAFKLRYERFGDLDDLDRAISMQEQGVTPAPDSHPDKHTCLHNLGNCFLVRFSRLGNLSDLEQGISAHRASVGLTPVDHPSRPISLTNLGKSLLIRFGRFGEQRDLEEAISLHRDAVDLGPGDDPNKPMYLDNLGNVLHDRFMLLGELSDLERAVSFQEDAVNLTPHDHRDKPIRLSNLGKIFFTRFERLERPSDLEQAISNHQKAVDLTPDSRSDKPLCLSSLGDCFLSRFEQFGHLNDLEKAISIQENAVSLVLDDDYDKFIYLNNLGNSLITRFERRGELRDLEQAISRYKHAISLTPDDHPDKPACMNNLGDSYITRYERLEELSDLEQAISRFGDAIDFALRLDGQPNKPAYLNNLSSCLLTRFERLGELRDLEQAISRSHDAVDLTPDGHPNESTCLNNLGNSLLSRFKHCGERSDLEHALSMYRNAVRLTSDHNVYKPSRLNNLGEALVVRFKRFGELFDLEQAVSRQKDAVHLLPDGHPDKPRYLSSLGNFFRVRFDHLAEPSDLEQAISLYSRAACACYGPVTHRFLAAQQWISSARELRHPSVLLAYSIAVELLPQLAWIGHSLTDRYHKLGKGADVVREAAAAALDSGQPETAVEWLEQGRSIVWGELFQLRSSYDELSSAHPDHARRLRELSAALEHAGATREGSLSSYTEETGGARHGKTESLEQVADKHRLCAIERDQLLQAIRGLPGFERFLLHKEFSELRASAHSGPVVILNAAASRSDALIVLADVDAVVHVPLPNYPIDRCKGFQDMLKTLVGPVRGLCHDDRGGQPAPRAATNRWALLLSPLWRCVVKPVLDALAFSIPGELSRIFWCPTGSFTFLPIHAAGFYNPRYSRPGHKVYDFVISSYVPTLGILAPTSEVGAGSKRDFRLLAVCQPASDGLTRLPGADVELEHIRRIINGSRSAQAIVVEPSVGTVEEVLDLMKDADWVHFACHGVQDAKERTRSGLCLADRRRLEISDMIALSRLRSRGGLAFLSACQTAKGDEDLSDEAIHIAAGMLFAGYGGVVGTMWSISDRLAPDVTKDVYEQLLLREGRPEWRDAARTLQDAVGRLRSTPGVSFVDWLPFIHVGL